MSGKTSQEAMGLGGYTAQRLGYENTFQVFPIETTEIRVSIISEVNE
jgi:hypothetical protein